ncbi:MAG TPA: hypothetical protein ENK03_04200 [Candidatus Cloacimonetes bacterium]|nr:hypothetical protein [Candidatus Cloacimonadota bacterium]
MKNKPESFPSRPTRVVALIGDFRHDKKTVIASLAAESVSYFLMASRPTQIGQILTYRGYYNRLF